MSETVAVQARTSVSNVPKDLAGPDLRAVAWLNGPGARPGADIRPTGGPALVRLSDAEQWRQAAAEGWRLSAALCTENADLQARMARWPALTPSELNAVLAGLRLLQRFHASGQPLPEGVGDVLRDGDAPVLSVEQLDELCEAIN